MASKARGEWHRIAREVTLLETGKRPQDNLSIAQVEEVLSLLRAVLAKRHQVDLKEIFDGDWCGSVNTRRSPYAVVLRRYPEWRRGKPRKR